MHISESPWEPEMEPCQILPPGFDEAAYLDAYPDVGALVASGEWQSALQHYEVHGKAEGRLDHPRYRDALISSNTKSFPKASVDSLSIGQGGRCLVAGWLDDTESAPLSRVVIHQGDGYTGVTRAIARLRREDAAAALNDASQKLHGFWAIVDVAHPINRQLGTQVSLTAGQDRMNFFPSARQVTDEALRQTALECVVNSRFYGDAEVGAFYQLDSGIGRSLLELNRDLSLQLAAGAYRMRFGTRRAVYDGSIIVVLYGKGDFLTLQAAQFSLAPGYDRYEFIYVCNSPELGESLEKDARNASLVYGMAITLIIMPGNVGFGVANNVGVAAAESDRVLIVNPDVFPRRLDWPQQHTEIVTNLPSAQTDFFGVSLYYDDGSLMHGGMYIEVDGGMSIRSRHTVRREILRVEHYGKGAPPATQRYLASRPVPAVTGAFMSLRREWFERLGGFAPEFIFGHYEDVDLCLRSLQAGTPIWIHDLPFWHLESKGAVRSPVHEGGRLVNRWHLTTTWGEFVKTRLNGRAPPGFVS